MNTHRLSESALEKALATKLEELLRGVGWLQGWLVEPMGGKSEAGFDILATVPLPGGAKAALCVECKNELRPSVFRMLADRAFSPEGNPKVIVPVLALPWVSPRVAELCAEHGWSWFDLAGNHRLNVPGLLQLQHTGNKPVYKRPRPSANLSTPEAGRVIRTLLLPENTGMRWTQREIQNHCQPMVSLGLVNKVVRHLRDEAFIEAIGDGGFRLRDPLKLLFAWRDAYRFNRHERKSYFTLLQGRKLREALGGLGLQTGGFAAYAAFSAADIQAPHVRQPKTWLYVREKYLPLFEEKIDAKQVDSGENLVVLIPGDDGVFYSCDGGTTGDNRMNCTNVVQTYVDLSHCGGRGEEAAEALLNQRLKPEWKLRGLNA
ncbi:MAG: type IV toxin-antitoxin system AbiEi family antitoxin [Verrucomicrobiae bacterium]|nr:type IV toxin-antitoxin system AbiEi family antitoxin [Verrucomicrobiae bacterium]